MFKVESLRKIGALVCLGVMCFTAPAWCENGSFLANRGLSGRIGLELLLTIGAGLFPEWLCWIVGGEETLGITDGCSFLLNVNATDIYIAKPSFSD